MPPKSGDKKNLQKNFPPFFQLLNFIPPNFRFAPTYPGLRNAFQVHAHHLSHLTLAAPSFQPSQTSPASAQTRVFIFVSPPLTLIGEKKSASSPLPQRAALPATADILEFAQDRCPPPFVGHPSLLFALRCLSARNLDFPSGESHKHRRFWPAQHRFHRTQPRICRP